MSRRVELLKSLRPVVLFSVLTALVIPVALRTPSASIRTSLSSTQLSPGCAAGRSAVSYYSNGSGAPASEVPVPCTFLTGYGGAESHIKVTPGGELVQEPAVLPSDIPVVLDSALALSSNQGKSWQLDEPANPLPGRDSVEPDGNTFPAQDVGLYVDRVTGRLFVALPTGFGIGYAAEVLLLSSPARPAGYTNWIATPMSGFVGSENSRFTSAPAPHGQPVAGAGEDVTYWCGNQTEGVTEPPILLRTCFRTLDGGATWQRGAILFTYGVPQHSQCGTNSETFNALDGNYPQGAPDGSLWVMVQCGGTTYLAKSTDEGATFPIIDGAHGTPLTIPGSPRELRVDSDGNLYAVGISGSSLELRISRDGGQTWSAPVNMTAPNARSTTIYQWQVAVGYKPGQVALSYLATRSSGGYDGYMTVTKDALDANPVFYSSTINSPNAPIVTESALGDDFVDVDLAPDGTPWASFYSNCPTNETILFCTQTSPTSDANGITGPQAETVGSLEWPANR
ncbi:MAG TPA: sialidase family protein [Acidimicrobiales bacterium]|nr:sialidase family protein [Acidimicrobiales bacterium]